MIGIPRKFLAKWRNSRLNQWARDDDIPAFAERVATYRMRGASIGKMVRLLGTVDGVNPHLVSIGDYSVIGLQSALLAHCPIRGAAPCRVGRFVYVGFGAIVLPGVSIGDHSLIGAGAVVSKDVQPGSVVVGNPARVLRKLTTDEIASIETTMIERRLFGSSDSRTV
jgi:acetyltransferase-like isoleucine patch superfamily enzyme